MIRSSEEWSKIDFDSMLEENSEDDDSKPSIAKAIEKAEVSVAAVSEPSYKQKDEQLRRVRQLEKKDKDTVRAAKEKSKLLGAHAKVAQLKLKRELKRRQKINGDTVAGNENAGRSTLREDAEKLSSEASKWRIISETVSALVENSQNGENALRNGDYETAIDLFKTVLLDVPKLESFVKLPGDGDGKIDKKQVGSCEHNSHDHCHGHSHAHGHHNLKTEDEHNRTVSKELPFEQNSSKQLGMVVERTETKAMLLLAQTYSAKGAHAEAANTLRDLLLKNSNVEEAWILRGKVFLDIGCPLLSELHLSNRNVDQNSKRIENLKSEIEQTVKKLEGLSVPEVLDYFQARLPTTSPSSCVVEDLLAQGNILFEEGFQKSAMIKYALALRIADSKVADQRELIIRCLGSFATSCVQRDGTDIQDAINCCNRILRFPPSECWISALVLCLRALAYEKLGLYCMALEDLDRAAISIEKIRQSASRANDSVSIMEKIPWPSLYELKDISDLNDLFFFVEKRKDYIVFLWNQVGQISVNFRLPLLGVGVTSGSSWPGKTQAENLAMVPSKRLKRNAFLRKGKPNFLFFFLPDHTSKDLVSSCLRKNNIQYGIEVSTPAHDRMQWQWLSSVSTTLSEKRPSAKQTNDWLPEVLARNGYSCEMFGGDIENERNDGEVIQYASTWLLNQLERSENALKNQTHSPFFLCVSLSSSFAEKEATASKFLSEVVRPLNQFQGQIDNTMILIVPYCTIPEDGQHLGSLPLTMYSPVLFNEESGSERQRRSQRIFHSEWIGPKNNVDMTDKEDDEILNQLQCQAQLRQGKFVRNSVNLDGTVSETTNIVSSEQDDMVESESVLVGSNLRNEVDVSAAEITGDCIPVSDNIENEGCRRWKVSKESKMNLSDLQDFDSDALTLSLLDISPTVLGLAGAGKTCSEVAPQKISDNLNRCLNKLSEASHPEQQKATNANVGRDFSAFLLAEESGFRLIESQRESGRMEPANR